MAPEVKPYYIGSLLNPLRRKTREVRVGNVVVGGDRPIVLQSMTTTSTLDTNGTVDQMKKLIDVGCEIVRVTTPTMADVENLPNIRNEMKRRGLTVPLVADVHFLPQVALKACEYVEKVRINPGNYADRKRFAVIEYTDAEYREELERIREAFLPVVRRAKELGVALRIGTNHGSLSDRIMNRFGDNPIGMVESALEFVRIAEDEGYRDIVLSMKASNVQVMIQAYRLLVARMNELGMDYPLHLGVTEAGEGEDGRIKSAMGIGSLLRDGLGDTIRVSLTEDPDKEIPVAKAIAVICSNLGKGGTSEDITPAWDFYSYARRPSTTSRSGALFRVRTHIPSDRLSWMQMPPLGFEPPLEAVSFETSPQLFEKRILNSVPKDVSVLLRLTDQTPADLMSGAHSFDELSIAPAPAWTDSNYISKFQTLLIGKSVWFRVSDGKSLKTAIDLLRAFYGKISAGLELEGPALVPLARRTASELKTAELDCPIHLHYIAGSSLTEEEVQLKASIELGAVLCDGIGDSVEISSPHSIEFNHRLAFNILQASRLRMSKTEYISCPSCGRTLFDLQETTARIRSQTVHLKGVKIAIMGCIVNGPGEMADADFGYVGSGPGFINLYVGKECVKRHIPSADADQRLIELIKEHGKWVEPPSSMN
jgi:(E)-4-hydroxy-3-methylbut-2-enyl-diphosphate synthase